MTKKKIITAAIFITFCHFVITSVIGHYIAVQIGTAMGQVVAGGLAAASDKNNTEDATTIYQNMKKQSDKIKDRWKVPELLISLPAKPLINLLLKDVRQDHMNKLIGKDISRNQFKSQGLLIDYTATFVNSLAFGLLLCWILKITIRKITTGSSPTRNTRAS